MRIAALDVGEARIGVAVSDELGITAQGLGVVRRVGGRRDLEALAALLTPYAPSRLVVGLPLDMRGTEGAAAARVRAFAERAAAHLALPLEFWDERLTTPIPWAVMPSSSLTATPIRASPTSRAAIRMPRA